MCKSFCEKEKTLVTFELQGFIMIWRRVRDYFRFAPVIPGGGLQSNECPALPAPPIFVFRIRPEQARPICSKQKCPGKAVGIHLIGGE